MDSGICATTDRQAQVPENFDRVMSKIEDLTQLVRKLEDRLTHVLRMPEPMMEPPGAKEPEDLVMLAAGLRTQGDTIQQIYTSLSSILDRLEL